MPERVLIVGGGSGGTILANSLDRRRFEVTVLSASLRHMFQPALLYIAFKNASDHVVRDERRLLKRHVHLIEDRVSEVNLESRTVATAGGQQLSYDQLVLSTGISTDVSQIPGLGEVNERFGDYHSTVAQAHKLWAALDAFEGGTIALGQSTPICKCPPSPVEGIVLTEELLRKRGIRDRSRLIFFTPYPRAYPSKTMNEIVEPILKDRGIEIVTFFDVDRIDPKTSTITSIEGEQIHYDLPIIVPPFVGADIDYQPKEVLDPSRFLVTDRSTLRIKGVEGAFGIGDATNLPTSKSGVGAHLEAKAVARTLSGMPSEFIGRTHCPLDLGGGQATFVIGTYSAPVTRLAPSRLKHFMKMMFARIYWLSLKGVLEPFFDVYFKLTAPREAPSDDQS